MSRRLIRVFPRRTKATPTDELAFVGGPTLFAEADEVHISISFSWDIPEAERLAGEWRYVTGNIYLGGPAFGGDHKPFIPGRYLKRGYVITSRGCPNRCWFCDVWRREGQTVTELPVTSGWNVLDDNLLACSEPHVRGVFAMLKSQPERALFTGGLEAARLEDWHIELLRDLRPKRMYFAYDTEDDYEPLMQSGRRLLHAGWTRASHTLCAYVLIGHPRDTIPDAERRLHRTWDAGFVPYAMLWRDREGKTPDQAWRKLQRQWVRPALIVHSAAGAP